MEAEAARWQALMGQRVRVTFENRRMSIPGRVRKNAKGQPVLSTNWERDYPLLGEPISSVEVRDPDSGRYVAEDKLEVTGS